MVGARDAITGNSRVHAAGRSLVAGGGGHGKAPADGKNMGRSSSETAPTRDNHGQKVMRGGLANTVSHQGGPTHQEVEMMHTLRGQDRGWRPQIPDPDAPPAGIKSRRDVVAQSIGQGGWPVPPWSFDDQLAQPQPRERQARDRARGREQGRASTAVATSGAEQAGNGKGRGREREPHTAPSHPTSSMISTACRGTNTASDANASFRAYMEDRSVVIDPFAAEDSESERWGFYAIYDGHGGSQAADYCEVKLHEVLLGELRAEKPRRGSISDEAVAGALKRTFERVDDQLRLVGAWQCGCTATVALVRRTPNAVRLHVANVGDSRGVVIDSNFAEQRVSRDHRPNTPSEVHRIESIGGFVSRGRVGGQLAVSRALGDHALKSAGVSWCPDVFSRDVTRDCALVIASDGIWDVMEDSRARQLMEKCMAGRAHDKAAKLIAVEALQRGSTDNISVLVTYFDGAASLSP